MKSSLTIAGIHVDCPYRAYPSQIAMMDRIIKALQRSQSCLLESPTGSGKSIALLCATLAWHAVEKERLIKEATSSPVKNVSMPPNMDPQTPVSPSFLVEDNIDEEFTDDCLLKQRIKETSACNSPAVNDYSKMQSEEDYLAECCSAAIRAKKPPKIYFGTRTHKQIKQLIREFRKTSYAANVKMAIMSGREQTCIHDKVSTMSSKNEACRDCINGKDGKSCQYYSNLKRKYESPMQLRSLLHKQNSSVFDIEDIVALGRSHTFCPYFATTRTLVQDAEIIFCPYNYLIDPMIRESLAIQLKDQVVIFDEAHNIEDSCRDSSSFDLTDQEIQETCEDLSKLIHLDIKLEHVKPLYRAISTLRDWMGDEIQSDRLKKHDYGVECEIMTGPECVAVMKKLQLDPDTVDTLKNHLKELTDDEDIGENEKSKQKKPTTLSPVSSVTLEKLLTALQYLYVSKFKFTDDYKLCLRKELNTNDKKSEEKGGWLQPGRRGSLKGQFIVTLSFWSMNPTVAFSTLGEVAKTVIVASGTLSPLVTFQSELGHNFQFQLEAAHVLPLDRVFIAAVGKGPNNIPLKATYQHTEGLAFQDELGQLLLDVSSVIPGGILCFFPSYSLMDKMHKRWMTTGQIDHISRKKLVVLEPRRGDKLTEELQLFFEAVAQPQSVGPECTGAILLAICRGKVSEGIDFADDHARAVITIGIPFPSIKDLQVDLKKKFNDEAVRNKKSTLTGGRWYETQAFRALNQALGRCIRHVKDWGSLILVDERFESQKSCASLSKWIRGRVQRFEQFGDMMFSLREFNERMVLSESQSKDIPSAADFPSGSGKDIVRISGSGECVSNGFSEKPFQSPYKAKAKGPKLTENGLSTGQLTKVKNELFDHSDDNFDDFEEEPLEANHSSSAVKTMSERVALSVPPTQPLKIEQFNEDSPRKPRHSHKVLERVRNGGDLNSSLNGHFAQMAFVSPVANSKRPCVDETNKPSWKRVKNESCSQQIVCATCDTLVYGEEVHLSNFTKVKLDKLPQQTFSLADSCECLSETTCPYAVLVANSALVDVECFSSTENPLFPLNCCYDRDSGMVYRYVFCKNCLKNCGCPMPEFLIGYKIMHSGELKLDQLNQMVLLAQGAKFCLQQFANPKSL